MTSVPPENRHMKISTGDSPKDLAHWAMAHPFTQQIDVLIPSRSPNADDTGDANILETVLAGVISSWYSGGASLSQIVQWAEDCLERHPERPFISLCSQPQDDDVWCIDTRGVLTLCVCKDTYEGLRLVGKKLAFKGCPEQYVITIPLQKNVESETNVGKRNAAIEAWDSRRGRTWDVLVYTEETALPNGLSGLSRQSTFATIEKTRSVHIPAVQLTHRPQLNSRPPGVSKSDVEDEIEDWDEDATALFEWIGMAGFGSQRLQVNDSVDPYIAVYEPPPNTFIGGITHLSWRGFFPPQFVQKLLDVIIMLCSNPSPQSIPFMSLTAHSFLISPVAFLPSSPSSTAGSTKQPAPRVPRADGEDTWSVIVTPVVAEQSNTQATRPCSWMMVESIGQWDARWG